MCMCMCMCMGMRCANHGYGQLAVAIIGATMAPAARGRYLAVQWRSEDWQVQRRDSGLGGRAARAARAARQADAGLASLASRASTATTAGKVGVSRPRNQTAALLECAGWAAARVLETMARYGLTEVGPAMITPPPFHLTPPPSPSPSSST